MNTTTEVDLAFKIAESGFKKGLKPFQVAGAAFLVNNPHALLADEMGLGKTVQAIAAAAALELAQPLVVCPASVRTSWYQELHDCGAPGAWDVISYEQAVRGYAKVGYYDGLILDEAHYLKTPDSQRTLAIFGKSGAARHPKIRARWALTGSPVLNRPRELWPMLKCLHQGFAGDTWESYANRYCGAYFDGFGLNTKGASHLDELRGRLEGFMLRRLKSEVLTELPEKIVTRVPLLISPPEQAQIDAAEAEIVNRDAKLSAAAEDFSQLGDMAHLLRVTGMMKARAAADFVGDLLETQEKVVVFFRHTDVGSALSHLLAAFGPQVFQGGMSDGAKAEAINRFRTAPGCRVFLGQVQAAGTGINGLQEVASNVVFAELDWTPGVMQQAIDRLHRIGQRAGSVNAYLLHVPCTMESAVLGVQNAKGSVVGRLMGEAGWRA